MAGQAAPGRRSLVVGLDASRAFVARPTGTENYSASIIEALVARSRHRYVLYARQRPHGPPPQGAPLRVLQAPRLWTHTRLALEVARRPPDVLFVPAHVLPLVTRPPAVVTVHDLGYLAFPGAHTAFQRWYLGWTTRRHVRRATHIIADSSATRADLIGHYGARPDRVTAVHLGVAPDLAPTSPDAVAGAARRLGLAPDARYVLHVGTLQPRKNLGRLVEAFARVADARADLVLVLAGGRGWGGEDLAGRADGLGVADRVLLPGYVDRADLAALYSGALAVVVPSLYEGFGLTALEGMACGAPVAASRTSSLPEVVGDAGLLFDPLDVDDISAALHALIQDADLRSRLAAAGRARAAEFTWARTAADTEAVLEGAVWGAR